jgi:ribosomal protein L23
VEEANRIAQALVKAGWYANVIMQSDGLPVLYVRAFSFEKLLLEAIDEGMSSLCSSSKQIIYSLLENTFNIKRQDIPHKIEEFADAIEKIFGLGAKVLETLIMERLNEKVGQIIGYPQEKKELIFTEYVMAARRSFLKKRNMCIDTQNRPVRKRLWNQTKEKFKQN